MREPKLVSIDALPLEPAHGGEGTRRLILQKADDISPNLEAFANTFLPEGGQFGWHKHEGLDEIMLCLSGSGTISFDSAASIKFQKHDLVYIPSGVSHTIVSPDEPTEYFFIRISA